MARKNKKISCAILIIGNEILSGRTKENKNKEKIAIKIEGNKVVVRDLALHRPSCVPIEALGDNLHTRIENRERLFHQRQ